MPHSEPRLEDVLTIVTTCKGRLGYLKQTLPSMIATGLPVVVVDYDCPDGAGDFVAKNFPAAKVVRVAGRSQFNLAEARNIGAADVASGFICFFDCDAVVGEAFVTELANLALSDDLFYVAGNRDLHGQCIVSKASFDRIGGYDEVITGWGGEDGDFYARLRAVGCRRLALKAALVSVLANTEQDRLRFTGGGSLEESHRCNVLYAKIKRDMERSGASLSLDERRKLRERVVQAMSRVKRTGRPLVIESKLPRELGAVEYLLDGSTGYLLQKTLRYRIAKVSASARLASAMREGRVLSGLRRRIRKALARLFVVKPQAD